MNLDALLQSHGDEAPSGPDVEYDDDSRDLEIDARPKETRQVGDTKIEGEEPDHKDIYTRALGILERTHDLRIAFMATHSGVRVHGFQALADGSALMRGYLEQYWPSCHPQLDEDDDDDPTARVNVLRNLTDHATMIRAVQLAPLTESRAFGRITMRDILMAEGELPVPEGADVPDSGSISAAFQDTDPEVLKANHAAAVAAAGNIKAIDAVFDEQVPGLGPDLDPLKKLLHQIVTRLAGSLGDETTGVLASAEEGSMDEATGATPEKAAPAPISAPGTITTRADVTNAIERIITYYETYEPSSPVPLMLLRAKRLVNADFMTIMRDMAPAGVENVSLITGDDE